MTYNEEAAALVWEIENGSEDIGRWVLTFQNEEIKGKGLREFLDNAAFDNGMTNVVFVKNLKAFTYLLKNQVNFSEIEFFGNGDKDFFYINVKEELELRNWDKFEDKVDNGKEFIKRLEFMRQNFKGDCKNRLGLKSHFRTTKAHDMWEDIKYRYYLRSSWNQAYLRELLPQSIEQYQLMFSLNRAAFYYQNSSFIGRIVPRVNSYDISSSHIGFMARKKYPSSSFIEANEEDYQKIIKNKELGWMGEFVFRKLRYKIDFPVNSGFWIQRLDNGDYLVNLTSVDIEWFKQIFEWDEAAVYSLYYCKMNYLPKEYINMVDELYRIKDIQKKGTYPKEICKFRAELPFGQSIKKVEYEEELKYDSKHDMFITVPTAVKPFNQVKLSLIKRGIPVQIGLWTVAYSRLELVNIMLKIGLDKVVYGDTDCVKFIGDEGIEVIKEWNEGINQEIKENKNNPYVLSEKLGRWQNEGRLEGFKTIGIKWYLTLSEDGEWDVKCAGGDKEALLNWLKEKNDCFGYFTQKMKCPKLFKTIKVWGKTLSFEYINGFKGEQVEALKKLCRQLQLYNWEV